VVTIEQQRGGKTERQLLEGLWVVDEEKLRGIDDARVVEIFKNGYMGWIYAHLLSLGNVRRLANRLDKASKMSDESTLAAGQDAGVSMQDGTGAGGNGSEPPKSSKSRSKS
jgi:hypothetical protein